jgi:hypothetical protein
MLESNPGARTMAGQCLERFLSPRHGGSGAAVSWAARLLSPALWHRRLRAPDNPPRLV